MDKTSEKSVLLADMLSQWARNAFKRAFEGTAYDFSNIRVVETANPAFGDFQCNGAMSLAKEMKKSPRDVAQTVINGINLPDCLEKRELGSGLNGVLPKSQHAFDKHLFC